MAEECPAHAALESFAAGSMAESKRAELEAHLARCLSCAEELERMTRAQLDLLVGHRGPMVALPPATSAVLDTVMRQAAESGGASTRPEPDRVLGILDAPEEEGALGTFAGYVILEIAGRGGMGVVLKARDRTLDRVVAIKVIFPAGTSDDSFSARFLEEARAVAAIHHDHIVTVHHAGMAKGLAYLVMPFHAEGTLERQLARTPIIAPMDVARAGLQLARALEATHARGILHRDLKPSNVLLEDGLKRVRLADFGLAQVRAAPWTAAAGRRSGFTTSIPDTASSFPACSQSGVGPPQSKTRTVAGTPHYMSPEQARGEAIDARSDLFGLGAVLFQMATGQTLYEGESSKEVLRAAALCELKPVREVASNVPAALAAMIDRLLAKRPEERFPSAEEVAGELERFINAEHRVRLWAKRAAVTALAACLVVGAAMIVLDWSGRTAVINTILSRRTGDAYYINGRFGTYARLPDALTAARANEIIEMRFSGERLMDPFQVGGKPLTIRAAKGFAPVLVATNNGQPLILVDAPLTLEGLTIWRRGPVANFAALISVENAPLHLLNCRLIRSRFQGHDILVYGRLRRMPPGDPPLYRALLGFQHGSAGYLRNCVVAGTQAAAIALRASTNEPARIEAENNLFVIDRTFSMRPEAETGVDLKLARSVLVTGALLDLDETGPVTGIEVSWNDCLVDRTQGSLIRVNQAHLGALEWKETNVVYAGQGAFVINRRRRALDSEAGWNELLRLKTNSHRLIDRQVFPETCVRSSLRLSAADLDPGSLREANIGVTQFNSAVIGEGRPYEKFRRSSDYRQWQKQVQTAVQEWQQRRAASAPAAAR